VPAAHGVGEPKRPPQGTPEAGTTGWEKDSSIVRQVVTDFETPMLDGYPGTTAAGTALAGVSTLGAPKPTWFAAETRTK